MLVRNSTRDDLGSIYKYIYIYGLYASYAFLFLTSEGKVTSDFVELTCISGSRSG